MKKYLNTPEEVIKALKEGKRVKTEDGWFYKLVDGIIVCADEFANWEINQNLDSYDKIYIEEVEPLKFEVGKFYKDRGGTKWLCGFIGSEKLCYPIKLVSQINGNEMLVTFEGKYNLTKQISHNDIIGEWED